jgi:hypothetical protein
MSAPRTANEYGHAIAKLLAELIPTDEHNRWMLTSHSALNGDSPILAMQKGNEAAVYRLLHPRSSPTLSCEPSRR